MYDSRQLLRSSYVLPGLPRGQPPSTLSQESQELSRLLSWGASQAAATAGLDRYTLPPPPTSSPPTLGLLGPSVVYDPSAKQPNGASRGVPSTIKSITQDYRYASNGPIGGPRVKDAYSSSNQSTAVLTGRLEHATDPNHSAKRSRSYSSGLNPPRASKNQRLERVGEVSSASRNKAVGLEQHQETVSFSKRYNCACGKSYVSRERLRSHMNQENGIRPHSCRHCNKEFARRDICTKHEKICAPRTDLLGQGTKPLETRSAKSKNRPYASAIQTSQVDQTDPRPLVRTPRAPFKTSKPAPTDTASTPGKENEPGPSRRNSVSNDTGGADELSCTDQSNTHHGPQLASAQSCIETPYPEEMFEEIRRKAAKAASPESTPQRSTQPPRRTGERCNWCFKTLDLPDAALISHLQKHTAELYGEKWRCDDCQMFFAHEKDLGHHLQAASKGHCGFDFDHGSQVYQKRRCTGHHPPSSNQDDHGLHVQMQLHLRKWEYLQLKTHGVVISSKLTERATYRIPVRMSVHDDNTKGQCPFPLASMDRFRSVPAYMKMVEKPDVAGLTSDLEEARLDDPEERALMVSLVQENRRPSCHITTQPKPLADVFGAGIEYRAW